MNTIAVMLYNDPKPVQRFSKGGLAQAAEVVRRSGRYGDSVLAHLTPEEFHLFRQIFGEPTINPKTGLPEFWSLGSLIGDVVKGVSQVVHDVSHSEIFQVLAPLVLNFVVPGLGAAIGSAFGAAGTTAAMLGSSIMGAAVGSIGHGWKGAVQGALSGLIGSGGGTKLGNMIAGTKIGSALGATAGNAQIVGNSLLGAGRSAAVGEDPISGALLTGALTKAIPDLTGSSQGRAGMPAGSLQGLPGGMPAVDPSLVQSATTVNPVTGQTEAMFDPSQANAINPSVSAAGATPPPTAQVNAQASAAAPGQISTLAKKYGDILAVLGAVSKYRQAQDASKGPMNPYGWNASLPTAQFNRASVPYSGDYYTYGERPEFNFYQNNQMPTVQRAQGGALSVGSRYIQGPGTGTSDSIDAKLSDGEYVIDAATVSALGDGSSKAGAAKLDQFRTNIRKHASKGLSKGKMPPRAKSPLQYLADGGKVITDAQGDYSHQDNFRLVPRDQVDDWVSYRTRKKNDQTSALAVTRSRKS